MKRKAVVFALAVPALLGMLAVGAFAQQGGHSGLGFGLRGGFGLNPDQVVVGAQFSLGRKLAILRMIPSVDFGFGENLTTIALNVDFLIRLILEDASLGLYAGAGPTAVLYDFREGSSRWEIGLTPVVGVQLPLSRRFATNLEARFRVGNIPDFRLLFAIIF